MAHLNRIGGISCSVCTLRYPQFVYLDHYLYFLPPLLGVCIGLLHHKWQVFQGAFGDAHVDINHHKDGIRCALGVLGK